jgi:hypothetical protein
LQENLENYWIEKEEQKASFIQATEISEKNALNQIISGRLLPENLVLRTLMY